MISFFDLIRYALAVASAGAGLAHLTAASAHRAHPLVFVFFVAAGFVQLLWAAALGTTSDRVPTRALLLLGVVGNAVAIAIWAVSRTSGIAFVAGAGEVEAVGAKDLATVVLEFVVIFGGVILLAGERSLRRRVMPRQAIGQLTAAISVIALVGVMVPLDHDHDHDLEAHVHLTSAGHTHEAAGAAHDHAHVAGSHGHAHDPALHAGHTHLAGGAHEHHHVATTPLRSNVAPAGSKSVAGLVAKVRYGPFVLPPASAGGTVHVNRILQQVAKPCDNCYITAMRPDLVYEDGSSANLDTGVMLHHAVWTRPWIDDTTCGRGAGIGMAGMRFFAAGNERTTFNLPSGFGYLIENDPWGMIVELMNHADEAKNVYITLDVTYQPSSAHLRNTTPVWLDVDNCADSEYSIPAGRSEKLWKWTSTLTGRVVATGGHVHAGGVKTVLTNETSAQRMCTSVAGYGHKTQYQGTVESMSTCIWDRLGTVREGEDLGLRAYYDSNVAQDDVMGIMVAFVYETSDLAGGTPYSGDSPHEAHPPPAHKH